MLIVHPKIYVEMLGLYGKDYMDGRVRTTLPVEIGTPEPVEIIQGRHIQTKESKRRARSIEREKEVRFFNPRKF
jgi:hypothetical protein